MSHIAHDQRGVTLIEVLVTVIILSIGLLGVAGLQSRLQVSEMEAYQRAQALILLNDMANRISTNRNNVANYVTGAVSPLGAGMNCPTATANRQQFDARDWCLALQGAGETQAGNNVGAMVGGRGCVEALATGQYLITVAWQGLTPLEAPPAGVACGANSYNGGAGSTCLADRCRRVVTTIVRVATL
jgi:type IV pilus assembly protein PilV